MPLPLEIITSFEKAVVCNSLHTDAHLHKCTPTTYLYSTLLEMRRHKIRCSCEACVSKSSEVMDLIGTIPQITSPRATDKETNEATFGSSSFREGWEICVKIFEIIRACHSTPNNPQNQCQIQAFDFDKLTTCSTTQIETQSKTNSSATETPSDLQRGIWKDSDTSDDDFSSLG